MLSAGGAEHAFLAFASLLRHAGSARLSPTDAAVVMALAAERGAALDPAFSLSALAMALHELPRAWAEHARRAPRVLNMATLLELLRVGAPGGQGTSSGAAAAAAAATEATVTAVASPTTHASSNAVADNRGSDAAGFRTQHLAQLREAAVSAMRALAVRVGTAAELCDALALALAAAGGQLGVVAGAPAAATAAGAQLSASTTVKGSLGGVADGPASAAAALPGAALISSSSSPPVAVEASEVAAAAVALQCAAAAADAFMQRPPQQQHAAPERGALLPGGVLPPGLISSALPLLRVGPAAARRPVQRTLTALLPAAPNVRPALVSATHAPPLLVARLLLV